MLKWLVALCAMFMFSGCVMKAYPGGPVLAGTLYTDVSSTAVDLAVETDKSASQDKVGEASAIAVFGLFAVGDATVTEAMKNAGIKTVHHVDYQNKYVLFGLFVKTAVIVYGE